MIYILLTILSIVLLFLQKSKRAAIGFLFVGSLLFIGGFRDSTIGTDTGLDVWYYHNFVHTTFNPSTWNHFTPFEPGFNLFIAFFKCFITDNYYAFYSLVFFLTYIFGFLALKKLKLDIILFFSFCFLSCHFANSMNIMRQMLALYIGFYFIATYLKNRQIWLYEVYIICLALMLHKSMFILCLFPLFDSNNIQRILTTKVLLIILLISLLLSIYGGELLSQNINLLSGLFGERADFYIEMHNKFGLSEREIGYIGPTILIICLIFTPSKYRNAFFYFSVIGLCASLITTSFLHVIGRLTINMSFFYIVYLTQFWSSINLKSLNKKDMYLTIGLKCLFVIYWIKVVSGTLINNPEFNPYKTYI